MMIVELFKKKSIVLITAIIFVGIAHAHEYADKHQMIRRLNRKKEVARRTIDRMDYDKEDVEFWTRLMKVGGSMPDGGGGEAGGPTTGLSPPPFTPAPSDSTFVPATTPPVGETGPPVTVASDPPVTVASDPPVTVETDPPVTMDTDPPVSVETDPPMTMETNPPVTVETDPPMTMETNPPVTVETDPPMTMATDPPVTMATDPPIGSEPKFNCPEPDFVGCTAPDPFNPEDECPTVGEPCDTGNGEYCCLDACPRNFCTAKEGRNTGE